ncbi:MULTISPECIES: ParB/RepB/Spo0J family partition protein [Nitrosopumilus]|uniref:Transcriptional regulator n=1 Tax=Nitrosopumilus piranensis TaxID=1582439 RepID=A0A0C5BWI8_9ARCH|nr:MULTISPECIES: ParB/RepB/Spo0J family partition protein [Nitrosopumilus]AJM92594.1 Transcriptional regulator [Nitrosopumilus piranensis]KAF6244473.1 transcriptional regulator [Nitrosopumilus sp. b2]
MEVIDNSLVEPIEIRMIRPSKFPVRYKLPSNSSELVNLKSSIKEHGLLQPIVIRPLDHGFEIVAGHRRFSACKSMRWRFIPSKIRDLSDKQAYEIQLTENIQRKSMDPIEEAEAYQKYVNEYGWGGVSELGKKIGKSEEYVSHRMQLLKLPDDVREKIVHNDLSVSQALELTNVDASMKSEFVDEIVGNKLTVKQIRIMKKKTKEETELYKPSPNKNSKTLNLVNKSNLALKITLSRIDDLIEDAHGIDPKQRVEMIKFLMGLRLKTHSMIDETIKFKKKFSK